MTTTTDSLKSAISYLGAVEVAPGRYAWRPAVLVPAPYFVADAQGVERAHAFVVQNGAHALHFPHMLPAAARDNAAQMPKWWTPERRYRFTCGVGHAFNTQTKPACEYGCAVCGSLMRGVTADLETGQEVNV
jgi:hypothetical protein